MRTDKAVSDFQGSCRAAGLSPRTISWYSGILSRFQDRFDTLPERPEPIEEFLAELSYTQETRHGYFRTLRALYNFTAQRNRIRNPIRLVRVKQPKPKAIRTLELSEVVFLITGARDRRDQALLTLLLDTGIRVGEVANLCHWDLGSFSIWVRGKTGGREVPISEQTGRLLANLGDGEHVFIGSQGPLTRSGLYRIVRLAMARVGIRGHKRGPHVLRHTFARQWILAGGDIFSLQKILGHTSLTMVRRYVELWAGDVRAQHRKYSPLREVAGALQMRLGDEVNQGND